MEVGKLRFGVLIQWITQAAPNFLVRMIVLVLRLSAPHFRLTPCALIVARLGGSPPSVSVNSWTGVLGLYLLPTECSFFLRIGLSFFHSEHAGQFLTRP